MQVNKKQLAEIFGISERSFTEYQRDPTFPYQSAKRGHENQYSTIEVHDWLVERATNKSRESAKERLDRLRGDAEEIKIGEMVGKLVPADDVERRLTDMAIAIRSGMMTGLTKLKNEIDLAHDINLDIDILDTHARHILTHLSTAAGNTGAGDKSRAGETASAAPDVDG
ncbi:terminase small subunit [Marinobacterium lutimaris]|uniref:Phage DNA packaging protein Nu1 n=1 Tax=Marinobacterium lutimaris TaxID=568106 RepID=A0A1H5XU11_9GAMM|nr:terminase small subunit [Marinobacterium lutimaris]SEG15143.1 Phage DNA packaging protein Nu1 [Marinobacterium lutimaris]